MCPHGYAGQIKVITGLFPEYRGRLKRGSPGKITIFSWIGSVASYSFTLGPFFP